MGFIRSPKGLAKIIHTCRVLADVLCKILVLVFDHKPFWHTALAYGCFKINKTAAHRFYFL